MIADTHLSFNIEVGWLCVTDDRCWEKYKNPNTVADLNKSLYILPK